MPIGKIGPLNVATLSVPTIVSDKFTNNSEYSKNYGFARIRPNFVNTEHNGAYVHGGKKEETTKTMNVAIQKNVISSFCL